MFHKETIVCDNCWLLWLCFTYKVSFNVDQNGHFACPKGLSQRTYYHTIFIVNFKVTMRLV